MMKNKSEAPGVDPNKKWGFEEILSTITNEETKNKVRDVITAFGPRSEQSVNAISTGQQKGFIGHGFYKALINGNVTLPSTSECSPTDQS
jgi:hypothetical protein